MSSLYPLSQDGTLKIASVNPLLFSGIEDVVEALMYCLPHPESVLAVQVLLTAKQVRDLSTLL